MSSESGLSLGEFLRQERERRGITLEQVASATKIGIRQLHALESDAFQDLPAKPFVKGFVTSYCRFVGLDHREILTTFSDYIERRSGDRPVRDAGHSGYAFERKEGDQSRTVLGILMVSFVVIGAVVFIVIKPSRHGHHRPHLERLKKESTPEAHATPIAASPAPSPLEGKVAPAPSPSTSALLAAAATPSPSPKPSPKPKAPPSPTPTVTATPTPVAVASVSPSPLPGVSPSPLPSEKPDPLNSGTNLKNNEIKHRLVFKAAESVWVRYRVDDRQAMQFVLKKDKLLILRAREKVVFQTGQADRLSYAYNYRGYEPLSASGAMRMRQDDATVVYPANLAETIELPFPKERPLSARPAPISPAPTPSVSPIP